MYVVYKLKNGSFIKRFQIIITLINCAVLLSIYLLLIYVLKKIKRPFFKATNIWSEMHVCQLYTTAADLYYNRVAKI
jgi:hypothetical protein